MMNDIVRNGQGNSPIEVEMGSWKALRKQGV
jgi:hypothetical protein